MAIEIRTPLWFSEIGMKKNQEDAVAPVDRMDTSQRCFVLCDGVGGHHGGEVASQTFATTLYETGHRMLVEGASVRVSMEKSIEEAWMELDKFEDKDGSLQMATTLATVFIDTDDKVLIAHIGDSRVYLVSVGKKGKIKFRTRDHSVVEELVQAKKITSEEAKKHPMAHVITRAIQPGNREAPTYDLVSVKSGDYLFLCSDGVNEHVSDDLLVSILNSEMSDKDKLSTIKQTCYGRTRDNYSAILIPIERVTYKHNWWPF